MKIAERFNECMLAIGKERKGVLNEIKAQYQQCLDAYNQYQKDKTRWLSYEEMHFDYSTANKCELCLHHCEQDREFVTHLGRLYHPECANMWIHSIQKELPVYTKLEESMY